MSDTTNFGFGKFVPGFDFLQNLASNAVKGASNSIPQLPNMANWVAPTISVEDLEKRIEELKAVQFWLDQNAVALKATIQALEVQKMTLATLKGMNFSMGDVANALKLKTADTVMSGLHKAGDTMAGAASSVSGAVQRATGMAPAAEEEPAAKAKAKPAKADAAPGVVDPMQWWGSLTQQFQQIATAAVKDAARQTAVSTTKNMASGLAKEMVKTATDMTKAATRKAVPAKKRAAAKKPAAKKSAAR